MTGPLERAKAHFRALPVGRMEVPEWGEGGKPLVATWKPMSLAAYAKLTERALDIDPGGRLGVCARAIAQRAHGEDGKRMFVDADHLDLAMKTDRHVVLRLGGAILADESSSEEEAKN